LASLVFLLGAFGWTTDDEFTTLDARAGMPAKVVRQQYGQPVRIPRQVLYRRHIEQWVYENPQSFRVLVSCSRSDEPVVTRAIPSRNGPSSGKN
jgi:hypothetical protein